MKYLREKQKLKKNFGTELHQNQKTLITHLNYYGRLQIQFCISLRKLFSNNPKNKH